LYLVDDLGVDGQTGVEIELKGEFLFRHGNLYNVLIVSLYTLYKIKGVLSSWVASPFGLDSTRSADASPRLEGNGFTVLL
jgi:hypothetical protein